MGSYVGRRSGIESVICREALSNGSLVGCFFITENLSKDHRASPE